MLQTDQLTKFLTVRILFFFLGVKTVRINRKTFTRKLCSIFNIFFKYFCRDLHSNKLFNHI